MAEHLPRDMRDTREQHGASPAAKATHGPSSTTLQGYSARLNLSPLVVAQRATGQMLARAATPRGEPVVQGYFGKGTDDRMSSDEVTAEIGNHPDLDESMKGEIWRRHGHAGQKYVLANTIRDLKSKAITPKAPPPEGQRHVTRREASGLVNLSHMDPRMLPLFETAALSPLPDENIRSRKDHLSSPSRHFRTHSPTHSHPPEIVTGHSNTVMGHGPVDAVDYWNDEGHTKTRAENKAHNSSASVYHGLEEKEKSAKSGGETKSRYRSPSPTTGSHPSHFLRTHEDFNPNVPWHTYEDEDAVREHRPYVPPVAPQMNNNNAPTGTTPPVVTAPPLMTSQPSPVMPQPVPLARPVTHVPPLGPTPMLNPPIFGGAFRPIHPVPVIAPTNLGPPPDTRIDARKKKKMKVNEADTL